MTIKSYNADSDLLGISKAAEKFGQRPAENSPFL